MMKKVFFVSLGCLSLALGVVGIVLPVLPTVPFFLLTAFCFAKSSARLHCWFLGTTLYKKYIGSYMERKGMTLRAKLALIGMVTALMAYSHWPSGLKTGAATDLSPICNSPDSTA